MEEDDDKEIEVAKKKGENFYKLLKAKKIDIDAVFKAIIDTTNYERQIMNDYISKTHSMSIIKALELTFSGNLREILIYMFYSPYELDARLLNVEKKKTKNFNKFLLCLFETEREEGPHIDVKEAEKIVEEMFKKGLKAYGTDLELFKKVFVTKSREDFILISRVFYKNNPKKINLYQACDEQVGSDNRELLKALVYAICDSSHYFGHNLKKAIVGFGTNVKVLNRILALRSEIDMDVIRERYLGETKRDLIEAIKGDTSGDYCKFLCMLASRNPKVTE